MALFCCLTTAREGSSDLRFPHKDTFEFANGAHVLSAAEVLRHLKPVIEMQRQQRLDHVASTKTYAITPVIEDIKHPSPNTTGLVNLGNVSAVCRTAEALGFQSLHILRTHQERYKASHNVSKGSEKWLDVVRWDSTKAGLQALRDRGYRIVTTHMHGTALPIGQLDWTIPTAVVLGNGISSSIIIIIIFMAITLLLEECESILDVVRVYACAEQNGVTDEAVEMADACCIIPMTGFTESFNISVAAAIIMYHAMEDRIRRQGFHADLTPKQQEILRAVWYLKENSMNRHIVERLLERTSSS
eukprot:jgi/Chlat1/322/Chrsp1S03074